MNCTKESSLHPCIEFSRVSFHYYIGVPGSQSLPHATAAPNPQGTAAAAAATTTAMPITGPLQGPPLLSPASVGPMAPSGPAGGPLPVPSAHSTMGPPINSSYTTVPHHAMGPPGSSPIAGGPPMGPMPIGPHLPPHLGPPNMQMGPHGPPPSQAMGLGPAGPLRLPMAGLSPSQIAPHPMGPGPQPYHHGPPMILPMQTGLPNPHPGAQMYPGVGPATSPPQPGSIPIPPQVPPTGPQMPHPTSVGGYSSPSESSPMMPSSQPQNAM